MVRLHPLDLLLPFSAFLLGQFGRQTFEEVFVFPETLESVLLRHVLACQIRLDLQFFLDNGHLLVLLPCLYLCLFDGISGLLLVLSQVGVEILHVLLQHVLCPFQPLLVKFGELFKLVDLLSFVVDQHLKQQRLSFLRYKIVHRLVDLDSILDCIFGCFDEAGLRLIVRFVFVFLPQVTQLAYRDSLLLDPLVPNLQVLVLLLLLPLSLFLLLLHAKDLNALVHTSASSGMAKGLSYFGTADMLGSRGRLPFLDSSSDSLCLIPKLYKQSPFVWASMDQSGIGHQMYCLLTR